MYLKISIFVFFFLNLFSLQNPFVFIKYSNHKVSLSLKAADIQTNCSKKMVTIYFSNLKNSLIKLHYSKNSAFFT